MTAPVNGTWQRIMNLLREHAPATAREIRPPGPAEDLRDLQRLVGLSLPADLVGWWALMDGIADRYDQRAGNLVPNGFVPLATRRVYEEYQRLSGSSATDPTCCGPDQVHQNQAGDDGSPICSALVPFCRDITGSTLCVDLRAGAGHGTRRETPHCQRRGHAPMALDPGECEFPCDRAYVIRSSRTAIE
ncbi:SMI1/KNR4 family protein [Amycolatopsis sp. lyj-90]|uniref:SMI1/KNR4 family protein n=1 Tax=Amycolatopsis sp. lyj-90 TaxID=2789285 RepID=UPI00397E2D4D